jgi:alkyl hydroperoxide reductase subunit AhpC
MNETVRVGQPVPDFKMETYDPKEKSFGDVSLAEIKKSGKWTVLVFYPADYTLRLPDGTGGRGAAPGGRGPGKPARK